MTQLASILILVLSVCLIMVTVVLRHETRARKDAETRAETAQAMWNAATKAMEAKQEARHEADEKIGAVRSANSGHDRFDAILHGMQNDTGASTSATP